MANEQMMAQMSTKPGFIAALAHAIGDETEAAYRRSDALAKRRKLMDVWAAYCEPRAASNVVRLAR